MTKKGLDGHRYRLGHPLAQLAVSRALERKLGGARVDFDYSSWPQTASSIAPLVGKSGSLTVHKVSITGVDAQDHIIFSGQTDDGVPLKSKAAARLFELPIKGSAEATVEVDGKLLEGIAARKREILEELATTQSAWFDEEMEKLDNWARDKRASLKADLKDYDEQIKELKKEARQTGNLPDKLALQKRVRVLEQKREDAWKIYDEAAKAIENQKDAFLDEVEGRMSQDVSEECLFSIRWTIN